MFFCASFMRRVPVFPLVFVPSIVFKMFTSECLPHVILPSKGTHKLKRRLPLPPPSVLVFGERRRSNEYAFMLYSILFPHLFSFVLGSAFLHTQAARMSKKKVSKVYIFKERDYRESGTRKMKFKNGSKVGKCFDMEEIFS